MTRPVHLALEDGSVFTGESFGAERDGWGEVVFNTTMTGYQEVLTDPSYAGQMVALTYPLVGNYGINRRDFESRRIQVSALIVRQHCDLPSHSLQRHDPGRLPVRSTTSPASAAWTPGRSLDGCAPGAS